MEEHNVSSSIVWSPSRAGLGAFLRPANWLVISYAKVQQEGMMAGAEP
jgi:hypothetical protein